MQIEVPNITRLRMMRKWDVQFRCHHTDHDSMFTFLTLKNNVSLYTIFHMHCKICFRHLHGFEVRQLKTFYPYFRRINTAQGVNIKSTLCREIKSHKGNHLGLLIEKTRS